MNVVDSSGWLEYFAGAPNAGFFAPVLQDTRELVVPTISLAEVFKRVLAQRGEDAALQAAALMAQGRVVDLTLDIALEAARIGHAHRLPLADSVMLASARIHRSILWTQDSDFQGLEGVRYAAKTTRRKTP